jgi:hypothetical protein
VGSLLIGTTRPGTLVYVLSVGAGWSAQLGRSIMAKLHRIGRDTSPFVAVPRPDAKDAHGRSQSWSPRWADIEGDYGEKHVALCDRLTTLCSWGRELRNLPVQVLKPNDHAVANLKLACPVFTLYDFVDTLSIATVGGYHRLQSRWRLAFQCD